MWKKFLKILGYDAQDYWVIAVYSAVIGLLSLALPIAVSYFVNSIGFLSILQPIVIVTFILFCLLSFSAFLNVMQLLAGEIFERRAYARLTEKMAYILPSLENPQPETRSQLANRFIEVLNIQKALNSILIEGLGLLLQTVSGVILLSFYHPYFIGFNLLMFGFFWGLYRVVRGSSFEDALAESKMKYRLFSWLQQLGRFPGLFLAKSARYFSLDKSDHYLGEYLAIRRIYYRGIIRQNIGLGLYYAVGSAAFLGICGWLVLMEQLSIGQLVAAELILTAILVGVWKFGTKIETIDQFLVAIEKLNDLFERAILINDGYNEKELGLEVKGDLKLLGVEKHFPDFSITFPKELHFTQGSRSLVVAPRGLGKSILAKIINRQLEPTKGKILLDDMDHRNLRLDIYRDHVHVLSSIEFFDGTLEDNLKIHHPTATLNDLRVALETVGGESIPERLEGGWRANLHGSIIRLSKLERTKLALARALLAKPRILVIDGLIDVLNEMAAEQLARQLCRDDHDWTLIVLSDRKVGSQFFNRVLEIG